jgi:hypothetical protein
VHTTIIRLVTMGGKRSFDEVEGEATEKTHGGNAGRFTDKRRKPNGNVKGKGKAKEGTNVWSKKRIRAIERLLQRDQGMPQDARNGLERELAGLKSNVADNSFYKTRSAMISRYHMVRFFGKPSYLTFPVNRIMLMNGVSRAQESHAVSEAITQEDREMRR